MTARDHGHLVSSPALAALRRAGTTHLYADTADSEDLRRLLVTGDGILAEIDGNTVNQPLARRVLGRYLVGDRLAACADEIRRDSVRASDAALRYTVASGWIGNDVVKAVAAGRTWEVSLQLHMGAMSDAASAKALGRSLRTIVPSCFVKVPFRPHEPQSFLIARDLGTEGIPVNWTSTFSARQVVAGALLAGVARTNIFMGRLNQGFRALLLGEHVALEAQRALSRLRRERGVETQLIVASIREWRSLVRLAGCDIFTAPCDVLGEFLTQTDVPLDLIANRLETSYEDHLGLERHVLETVGQAAIARLWRVEPEFVEFLTEYRTSAEYRHLRDGERLRRRFESAGFGDFFHVPDAREWQTLKKGKLPDLSGTLVTRLAVDTHMSLLADGDFVTQQEEIDAALLAAATLARHGQIAQDDVPTPAPASPSQHP
jgi:transaldolase